MSDHQLDGKLHMFLCTSQRRDHSQHINVVLIILMIFCIFTPVESNSVPAVVLPVFSFGECSSSCAMIVVDSGGKQGLGHANIDKFF